MIGKKFLKGIDRTARAVLAVGLSALVGISVWAGVISYRAALGDENTRPTLLFRCMDFELVEDGTIRALMRVSAENMKYFNGAAFNISYNSYYIQPSYLETADGHVTQKLVQEADSLQGKHYIVDPALEEISAGGRGVSPFLARSLSQSFKRNEVNVTDETMSMYLKLNNQLAYSYDPARDAAVQAIDGYGVPSWEQDYDPYSTPFLIIDASGNVDEAGKDGYEDNGRGTAGHGVNLGSLSFQVDPDHLTEMVTRYSDFGNHQDPGDLGSFLIGYPNGEKADSWLITDIVQNAESEDAEQYKSNDRKPNVRENTENGQGPWGSSSGNESDQSDWAQVVFEFIFPKVLVKADVAGGSELTVNAYQAYGDGTLNDIAATLQRYRPEITATYADATEEAFVFDWGDTGSDYTVYRPYVDGVDAGDADYTDRQSGKRWMKLTSDKYTSEKMYKGGEYMVTQDFYYEENGETKKFPLPMEVHLTVTPVNLVDANATGLTGTYTESEIRDFDLTTLKDLDLPQQALLGLSPVPGSVVLTMPIALGDWTPDALNSMVTTDSPGQSWPAVGKYELAGPDRDAIIAYVESNYPWVTTDGFNKDIQAERTIVADGADSAVSYTAEYVATDEYLDGLLHLRAKKTQNGMDTNFEANTQFRTYLPSGILIDTTSASDSLPKVNAPQDSSTLTNGAKSATVVNGNQGELYYYPGTADAGRGGPRQSHQENVARAINLGGWFYVSVDEGDGWSDLLPVYVPPRTNYYIASNRDYYNNGGAGSGDSYYNFDFTDLRAALYPFYVDSVLPTNVVLPVGYTVSTTYDGATGAEPGQLGEFQVAQWAAAEENNASHTALDWTSGAVVNHGDPQDLTAEDPTDFRDAVYAAFGAVENHKAQIEAAVDHTVAGEEQVHMRVQVVDVPEPSEPPEPPEPTPEPGKKPEESIRLIHEDTRFPSDDVSGITRAGGEVSKVTYTLQTQGYIARQTYTLTIENTGSTDIYGLGVDVRNGVHTPSNDGYDNHFEVLIPPTSYLPAGGKTTFVITYVYNLLDTAQATPGTLYEDHILITSNSHGTDDPLKDFIANFKVVNGEVYKVTVKTVFDPTVPGVTMGTAGIVEGPANQSFQPADQPNGSDRPSMDPAASTYLAGHRYVWIGAWPEDEYRVRRVYCEGAAGTPDTAIPVYTYTWTDSATGETVTAYFFAMPARDVTVVVEFYEPIMAKLRLSRLMGYADSGDPTVDQTGTIFDDTDELARMNDIHRHNIRWYEDTGNIIQTDPTYTDLVDNIINMSPEDSSQEVFLMVLGDYANGASIPVEQLTRAQLRIRLRKNLLEPNIDPVEVSFYEYDMDNHQTLVSSPIFPVGATAHTWNGTPDAPDFLNSYIFAAPAPGEVKAVEIKLTTTVNQAMEAYDPEYSVGDTVSRSFIVVITRASEAVQVTLNYGNSPKGMIYNDSTLSTPADRLALWNEFRNNGNSFVSLSHVPSKAADLDNTYWAEAWGGGDNIDADETALFILLGQPFQDPGFISVKNTIGMDVSPSLIQRTVKVELLDDRAGIKQADRFAPQNVQTVTLDMGSGDTGLVSSSDVIDKWWQERADDGRVLQEYAIRPGVYEMEYTFPDYDGTIKSVPRTLVILAPVGDVNADRKVADTDGKYIQGRVTDPLGGSVSAYPAWRLFRYRVCDVNNDRNVNNIDANRILRSPNKIATYYKPTGYVS